MIKNVWTYTEDEIESTCLEMEVIREADLGFTVVMINHDPETKPGGRSITIDLPSEVATDLVRWLSAMTGGT